MKCFKMTLFLIPILYTFTSCAHKSPLQETPKSEVVTSSHETSAPFSAADQLKEMAAKDTLDKMRKQIEISAFENRHFKSDKKMTWKCIARSGNAKFSMSSHDALMAKNSAQKACEKRKGSSSCFVSECIPTRI